MSSKNVSEMTAAEIRAMCGATRTADEIYREIEGLRRTVAPVPPTAPPAERLVYWEAEVVQRGRREELWHEFASTLSGDLTAPAWGFAAALGAAVGAGDRRREAEDIVEGLRRRMVAA